MRRVTENIFLSFALGAGVGMALLVGWSLTLSNRLSANDAFPLFFLILPVVAAVYAFSKPARAKGGHWAVRWLGTTTLGLLVSGAVWGASSFIPFKPNAAYNYPRFHYSSSYEQARERLVNAGGPAMDETVYMMDGSPVQLSDLWRERPVVIEFGSIT